MDTIENKIRILHTYCLPIDYILSILNITREEYDKKIIVIQEILEKTKIKNRESLKKRMQEDYEYAKFIEKVENFKNKRGAEYPKTDFNYKDIMNKFGPNPICYLSGHKINYKDPSSFSLDHFIPPCCGGTNELSNLKLIDPGTNMLKGAMPLSYLFNVSKRILQHNGYTVINPIEKKYEDFVMDFTKG